MFESAELNHDISKAVYKREEPKLRQALLEAQNDLRENGRFAVLIMIAHALLAALESRDGFVACGEQEPRQAAPPLPPAGAADWPDWRGPNRDGRVPWLPATLPAPPPGLQLLMNSE